MFLFANCSKLLVPNDLWQLATSRCSELRTIFLHQCLSTGNPWTRPPRYRLSGGDLGNPHKSLLFQILRKSTLRAVSSQRKIPAQSLLWSRRARRVTHGITVVRIAVWRVTRRLTLVCIFLVLPIILVKYLPKRAMIEAAGVSGMVRESVTIPTLCTCNHESGYNVGTQCWLLLTGVCIIALSYCTWRTSSTVEFKKVFQATWMLHLISSAVCSLDCLYWPDGDGL